MTPRRLPMADPSPRTVPQGLTTVKRPWATPAVKTVPLPTNPLEGIKVGEVTLYGPFYRTRNVRQLMTESGEWWGRDAGNTGGGILTPEALAYTTKSGQIYDDVSTQFFTTTRPVPHDPTTVGWPTHRTFGWAFPPEPYPGVRAFTLNGEDW